MHKFIIIYLAAIGKHQLSTFALEYRQRLMARLATLSALMGDYLRNKITLDVPINQIKQYLQHYPDSCLLQQTYFDFYPALDARLPNFA